MNNTLWDYRPLQGLLYMDYRSEESGEEGQQGEKSFKRMGGLNETWLRLVVAVVIEALLAVTRNGLIQSLQLSQNGNTSQTFSPVGVFSEISSGHHVVGIVDSSEALFLGVQQFAS